MILVTWLLIFGAPLSVLAHGGEVRIELNVTQASPGATIDLRGSGFEQGDTVTIMLVGAKGQLLLGSATADGQGDLSYALLLPMDLANGAYEVRVADTHHVAIAPLNIVPDTSGDEEGSQREQEEPLLAPMPTRGASTGFTGGASSVNTPTSTPTTEAGPAIPTTLLFSSALAIVILVAVLVVIARRNR